MKWGSAVILSDLCAGGSINKLLSGKHYNHWHYVFKTFPEALEQLLLEQDEICGGRIPLETTKLLENLAKKLKHKRLQATLALPSVSKLLDVIKDFEEEVRCRGLGKIAVAWINFMGKIFVSLEF